MELYLLRHGIAEEARPGRPDSARELTDEGREKVASVARLARSAGVSPALILTSPYVRAVETARTAARHLGFSGPTIQTEALTPFGSPEGVWRELRDYPEPDSILLASHEPLMSQLAAWLLGAPELRVEMKKGTMIRIDVEMDFRGRSRAVPPPGTLRWMLTARLASCAESGQ